MKQQETKNINYMEIEEINAAAAAGYNFAERCERDYNRKIVAAAEQVVSRGAERPIVLIAGPSGSGKTTTALRLGAQLRNMGHEAHVFSLDNYYYRRADGVVPYDEEGVIDLESPEFIDAELLTEHLRLLSEGKPIDMPSFDFVNQRRNDGTTPVHRKPGEFIIMEGIHALDPAIFGDTLELSTRIYVSVRTRLRDKNGYTLHPSRIRLMRRLIRDERTRGQSYRDTIARLRSVERGERMYINPNKESADISFDTFFPYEICLYRGLVLPELEQVPQDFMEDCYVEDIVPMLRQVDALPEGVAPPDSVLREFIGGQKL